MMDEYTDYATEESAKLKFIESRIQDIFNQKVTEFLDGGRRREGIHISDLVYPCLRKAYFSHVLEDKELDIETKITFWIGHKLHELGIGKENELAMIREGQPTGTLDDLVELEWDEQNSLIVVVDKKTTKRLPKKAYDHHVKQIRYYAVLLKDAFNIDAGHGSIVYIDVGGKTTSVKAFEIGNIDKIREEMMEKYNRLEGAIVTGVPPEKTVTWLCDGKNRSGKRYCMYADICDNYENVENQS